MISQSKKAAKRALQGRWLFVVGAVLLFNLITTIPVLLSPATYTDEELLTELQQTVDFATVILSVLLFPLSMGWEWLTLSLTRTSEVSIKMLFKPFKVMLWKSIWVSLFTGFFIFLWSLLLIVPGIIKSISYSFTMYILYDRPELSATQAITESRRMLNGHKMQAFLLILSFLGWFLLGVLTLGIGFLFIYPYYSVSYAQFYEEVKRKEYAGDMH